jgi:hypothetical protein
VSTSRANWLVEYCPVCIVEISGIHC